MTRPGASGTPAAPEVRRVRPPALPTRTASPAPAQPDPPPAGDRSSVRRAARRRRRVESEELRRPRPVPRRRRLGLLAGAAATAVLFGGPLLLAFGPFFTVRTIQVSGADGTVPAAVRTALEGQLGTPVALVGDADVARALRAVPAVERFTVVRRPPGTLEVVVVARTPVAQAASGAGWAVLDAARVVIGTSVTRSAELPVVEVPAGPAGAGAFRAAVSAVRALGGGDPRLTRVRATTADDVVLTLDGGPRVRWGGAEDGPAKAEALRAVLVRAARGATEIDVSSPGVVRTR